MQANYWEVHPNLYKITGFNSLYKNDKSKNKTSSSNVMWALEMLCSNDSKNIMKNMTRSEREAELLDNYINDEEMSQVLELEKQFVEHNLSYLAKRYRFYQGLLEQREDYMASLNYEKHASQLDDMLVRTPKIWGEFMKIKKELEAEELTGHVQGGREESASEKGLI